MCFPLQLSSMPPPHTSRQSPPPSGRGRSAPFHHCRTAHRKSSYRSVLQSNGGSHIPLSPEQPALPSSRVSSLIVCSRKVCSGASVVLHSLSSFQSRAYSTSHASSHNQEVTQIIVFRQSQRSSLTVGAKRSPVEAALWNCSAREARLPFRKFLDVSRVTASQHISLTGGMEANAVAKSFR